MDLGVCATAWRVRKRMPAGSSEVSRRGLGESEVLSMREVYIPRTLCPKFKVRTCKAIFPPPGLSRKVMLDDDFCPSKAIPDKQREYEVLPLFHTVVVW